MFAVRRSAVRAIAQRRLASTTPTTSSTSNIYQFEPNNPAKWPSIKETMLAADYHEREHARGSTKFWFNLNIFLVVPALIGVAVWALPTEIHHIQHLKEHPNEYVAWPHLRKRKNPFPWYETDHSLFHHPAANPGPEVAEE
ncbi:Cytochrome c oxidase subunit 6A1, mitochondrial [Blyttiomyces sp. JEL0837]|nr:Cytochrome c oxidase subunit 6A1, mitochondrial [Blyttiomyces sp. JEL0837]